MGAAGAAVGCVGVRGAHPQRRGGRAVRGVRGLRAARQRDRCAALPDSLCPHPTPPHLLLGAPWPWAPGHSAPAPLASCCSCAAPTVAPGRQAAPSPRAVPRAAPRLRRRRPRRRECARQGVGGARCAGVVWVRHRAVPCLRLHRGDAQQRALRRAVQPRPLRLRSAARHRQPPLAAWRLPASVSACCWTIDPDSSWGRVRADLGMCFKFYDMHGYGWDFEGAQAHEPPSALSTVAG